jgi:hypothetical protein
LGGGASYSAERQDEANASESERESNVPCRL